MPAVIESLGAGLPPAAAVVLRLAVAGLFGALVAFIYRRARGEQPSSFTATLVLLSILIAMITQVIGDNVARAFSLVGALSIVRFRTVVRDTHDTAYVIFAVAVGMAVGAGNMWLASAGIAMVAVAAAAMRPHASAANSFILQVRIPLGRDPHTMLGETLDRYFRSRELVQVTTARQGSAIEVTYRGPLVQSVAADEFVAAVNRVEGVQSVSLRVNGEPAEY